MNWQIDHPTHVVALNFPLPIYATDAIKEYSGHEVVIAADWQSHLRPGDTFPLGKLTCGPVQIMEEFKAAHYLQAIALTVCWGGMDRTKKYVYRKHRPEDMYDTFSQCVQSIRQTKSIQQSWDLLTNGLSWTAVMSSKTLHFMCRALGFDQDPPVPIDNKVIRQRVWPGFRIGIPPGQRPQDWEGNTFAAYCRYMTAIIEWANMKKNQTTMKNWTTTDLQATIFAENL
jgi:hypothetical protein